MFMHVISMALQVVVVLQQEHPYLTNQHVNVYHNALPHHSAKMHCSVNTQLTPHLCHCTSYQVTCVCFCDEGIVAGHFKLD
jgi:hypothetical protein